MGRRAGGWVGEVLEGGMGGGGGGGGSKVRVIKGSGPKPLSSLVTPTALVFLLSLTSSYLPLLTLSSASNAPLIHLLRHLPLCLLHRPDSHNRLMVGKKESFTPSSGVLLHLGVT